MLAALLDEPLATEKLATELSHQPAWVQVLAGLLACGTVLVGPAWKLLRAFRKARREAMDDAMQGFEELPREPTQRTPRALPPPPALPSEVYERIEPVEAEPVDDAFDDCRAEVRVLRRLLREEQERNASVMFELTRRLQDVERRCERERERLEAERDALADRLAAVERADTDRPPPFPRRRAD